CFKGIRGRLRVSGFGGEQIPFDELKGLEPRAWLCAGAGVSREVLKARVFERGISLVAEAVTTPTDLALRILRAGAEAEVLLGPLARQEVLRGIFAEPKMREALREHFPELNRLRRQRGF